MLQWKLTILVSAAITVICALQPAASAQEASPIGGRWGLNRDQSQFPREIGFGADWLSAAGSGSGQSSSGGGGRGRRGGGGAAIPAGGFTRRESEDDAKRMQQLLAEIRNPPAHLVIEETGATVTVSDDRGQSRTFRPDGRENIIQLDGVPATVITRREQDKLVILYKVEQGRDIRYTYSTSSTAGNPAQLIVDVQLIERGGGDKVRRVYDPATAAAPSSATPSPAVPPPGAPPPAVPPSGRASAAPVPSFQGGPFNQQPDAELKGLTNLGIVVEELTPQATGCGLNQAAIETALTKRLTDAGLRVRRNSDEDTYLYANIITTSASDGLCVSRYDAFLYTHTTATLSYQQKPVLVQVSLLHKGGITGGAAAGHGEAVLRALQEYVDQFSSRIRDANR